MAKAAAAISFERERAIYERVVAAMDYPEPSALVHDMGGSRVREFARDELLRVWREAVDRSSDDAAWNVYLHVPFCKSICDFCNYKRLHVSSRAGLDTFVASLEAEIRAFAPAVRGARFGALYVGGGTPSVLAADQLERLFTTLFESLEFRSGAQKNFEFDPMVMTQDRFAVLQRFGFTRYSFGIQSVDVEINRLHNRGAQTRSHLERQFKLLGEHGADYANVDFLLGLSGTNPEQMLAEIESVMRDFQPQEICVYFIYPTPEYVAAHFEGDFDRFKQFLAPFEAQVPPALARLAEVHGYDLGGSGKHAITLSSRAPRRSSGEPGAFYCDIPASAHRPLHVLGLGDSARSRIFGEVLYRAEHDYGVDAGPGRYMGVSTTMSDEMFAYVSMVLRDGDVLSRKLFQRTFGADPVQVFDRALRKLYALGVVDVEGDGIRLARQSRDDRLRDILFFLPPERRAALGDLSPRRAG